MGSRSRLRQSITSLLLTAGLISVLLGTVLTYATQVLFDQRSFADRAARSVREAEVANLLADRISQAVIMASRDLTAYRPLIFFGAREVVSSSAFAPVVRTSAETLHFVAFSPGGKNLLLNIADGGTLLKSALPALPPGLAERIPKNLAIRLTENSTIYERINQALPKMREIASLSGYSRWILVAGVLFLALAAAISPAPWLIGRETGWLLVLTALLLVFFRTAGAVMIRYLIDDREVADAVSRIFQMNHWITRVPAPRPSDAEIVNSYGFLMKRARQCMHERNLVPNLIAVDFYRTGDLFKVVDELNQSKQR